MTPIMPPMIPANIPPLTWGEKCLRMARSVFPDWDDDHLGYVLWNETGFPCFWEFEPEFSLMMQLIRYRDFGHIEDE